MFVIGPLSLAHYQPSVSPRLFEIALEVLNESKMRSHSKSGITDEQTQGDSLKECSSLQTVQHSGHHCQFSDNMETLRCTYL